MIYPTEHPGDPYFSLEYPRTLVEGKRYFAIEHVLGRRSVLKSITFVGYTACPAVVVIANGYGIHSRCLRDDLLEFSQTLVPE